MQKVILFDIDHTLFDTKLFFRKMINTMDEFVQSENKEEFFITAQDIFKKSRNEIGRFDIAVFIRNMVRKFEIKEDVNVIEEKIWDNDIFEECLYKEDEEVLNKLIKNGYILGIFSTGDLLLQKRKITKLQHFFKLENIHIYIAKEQELHKIIKQYNDKKLYIIDDYLEVLSEAKALSPEIIAIWMNRQEKELPNHFIPDFTVTSLTEIFPILENNIDK